MLDDRHSSLYEYRQVSDELDSPSSSSSSSNDIPLLHTESHPCHIIPSSNRLQDVSRARRKLIAACCLCTLFVSAEVVGGILSSSLAILTDAAHVLSDFASFLSGLISIWVSSRSRNRRFNFGYYRAEALGALFTVVLIWYVTGILLYLAGTRLYTMDFELESDTMIVVAGVAVIFNIVLSVLFHQHGPTSHLNVRAAFVHALGDLLQSVGVLISSVIIKIFPEYKAADPLCTVVFSVIVFFTTIQILRDTCRILCEGVPTTLRYDDVLKDVMESSSDIVSIHDLCLWSLTSDQVVMTCHVAVVKDSQFDVITRKVVNHVRKRYPILSRITIQVEEFESVMNTCNDCLALK